VTNKEILENFIQIASEAAAEYDCGFFEPTFGEDEQGVFAQTMLARGRGDAETPCSTGYPPTGGDTIGGRRRAVDRR